MSEIPFPSFSSDESAVQLAGMLTAAACSMLQYDNRQAAVEDARRIFRMQYEFVLSGQWQGPRKGMFDDANML